MAEQTVLPPSRPQRATMIRNLVPRLPERGHIKIGELGEVRRSQRGGDYQLPVKLSHFKVTTLERGKDGNFLVDESIHETLGGPEPTEIPIRLLYDAVELNFPTRYACYTGKTLWCSGDGESASRVSPRPGDAPLPEPLTVSCPCNRQDPTYKGADKCKINGRLSALIEGAGGVGGVWVFRTTSYNSVVGIMSSLAFLRQVTGGILANMPLKLRIQPKQATNPTDQSSVLIYVVSVEFAGGDVAQLQQIGHQIALDRATTHVSIANIEAEARRLLELPGPADAVLPGDVAEDIVAEFYPEQNTDAPEPEPRPTREQFTQPQPAPEPVDVLAIEGAAAAKNGTAPLQAWWGTIGKDQRKRLADRLDDWKRDAAAADELGFAVDINDDMLTAEEAGEGHRVEPEETTEDPYIVIDAHGEITHEGLEAKEAGDWFLVTMDKAGVTDGEAGVTAVWEANGALMNMLETDGWADLSKELSVAYGKRRERWAAKDAEAKAKAETPAEVVPSEPQQQEAPPKATRARRTRQAAPAPRERVVDDTRAGEAEPAPEGEPRADFWNTDSYLIPTPLKADKSVQWWELRDTLMFFAEQARTHAEIEKYTGDNQVHLRRLKDANLPVYAQTAEATIAACRQRLQPAGK